MPERLLYNCRACGGDVSDSVKHIMLECPRSWECHRGHFGTLAQDFNGLVRQFATSLEDTISLLLGGVPLSLHGAIHHEMRGFSRYGA
jgi:hypothetical protein